MRQGTGMPATLYLEQFGSLVWHAFGTPPYLVGSALRGKEWRDVDVRVILPDEEYERWFGTDSFMEKTNGRWSAFCMAFSELGRRLTGLPIDFQVQSQSHANRKFGGEPRQALGMVELRIRQPERGGEEVKQE